MGGTIKNTRADDYDYGRCLTRAVITVTQRDIGTGFDRFTSVIVLHCGKAVTELLLRQCQLGCPEM